MFRTTLYLTKTKMAGNTAAKKREVRRKRILENAENRLLKLANVESGKQKDTNLEPNAASTAIFQELPAIDIELCNGSATDVNGHVSWTSTSPTDVADGIREVRNRLNAGRATTPTDENESPFNGLPSTQDNIVNRPLTIEHPLSPNILLHRRKSFVALLALLVRIALFISDEMTIFKYILMPITTFELCLFVISALSEDGQLGGRSTQFYLSALLLLLGVKNGSQIAHYYNVCVTIFEDYVLFMFTFFVSHCLTEMFT